MTNNIQKLYELAGVEKRIFSAVIQGEFPQRIHERCYPPFTPEKQLELIKWLAKNIIFGVLIHTFDSKFRFNIFKNRVISHTDFSQALAGLVCELWEDLTPEQQAEIKRILE